MSTQSVCPDYDLDAVTGALEAVGLLPGDVVFSHVGVGMLGYPPGGPREQIAWRILIDAFEAVLGSESTWLVPTYSYTYTKPGEVYDPAVTPSEVGSFTEYFRKLPGVRRSLDPIHSVAALGPRADELIADLPQDCFGEDSVYARLTRVGAGLCNVGVGFRYATYIHHAEQMLGVPYRFKKYFTGRTRVDGREREETWLYNVRALEEPSGMPDLRRLEAQARARGLVRVANVGRGQITCVALQELYPLIAECVRRDPWFMARGGAEDYTGNKAAQVGRVEFSPAPQPSPNAR